MRIIVHQFAGVAMSLVVATVMAQQRQPSAGQEQARPQERQELRQEQRQERRDLRQQQRGEAGQQEASLESHIANCLILGNQAEIALLRIGAEKSENDEIKQLSQKMIQDHEEFLQKLEQFASRSASELAIDGRGAAGRQVGSPRGERDARDRGERDARDARPADQARPDTPRRQVQRDDAGEERGARRELRRRGGAGEAGLMDEIIRFEQNCAEELVSLVKNELEEKEGSEFDKAFVGQQIGAHVAMLAKLKTAEDSVSSEFQQVVREGQQTAKEHKQQLEKVKEDLMSSSND